MGYHVLLGKRPRKPENASTIGFSDSLWDFTEHCWHGRMELRPRVGKVVTYLSEAAAAWGRPMPPHSLAVGGLDSEESLSDSEEPSEFEIPIPLRSCSSSNGTVLFPSDSEGSTKSEITVWPFGGTSTPPTQFTELPQEQGSEGRC